MVDPARSSARPAAPAAFGPVPGLRAELDDRVGRLVLDRPHQLNPLSTEVLLGIESAVAWFEASGPPAVVVVSGEGRAFCAGADVAAFLTPPDDGLSVRDRADAGRRMAEAIESLSAVTVARIQGHCVGGGVVLASSCDIRVAAQNAQFRIPEVDLGIPLAWGGIPRLIREIGAPATRDLVMTCRIVDAVEARGLGLVQRVVPDGRLDDEVERLVDELSRKARGPMSATKRHVDAVTRQMVGSDRAWSDADGLVAALHDPESREAGVAYLGRLAGRGGT
jgi:enoyl-CoA hydratase/carnithine racemase